MESLNLDKFDIEVLYCLYVNRKRSPLQSFKIADIMDNTELNSSYHTYRKRINEKLIENNLITEGYMDGRSKTYYINEQGIKYLEANVISKEDIYEEVIVDIDDYEGGKY